MAYTCPKCGWKHKPSQEKYYQSRGLTQPSCIDCNPTLSQKARKVFFSGLHGSFSNTYMGRGPIASIFYLPVLMLLSVSVAFISPKKLEIIFSFLFFVGSYVATGVITQRVGDIIGKRIIAGKPVSKIVLAYYCPLILIAIACIALWIVKVA